MQDERMQILKMLEEGKITAEEAAQLLEAVQASAADGEAGGTAEAVWESPRKKAKWMRIEVQERNGNQVHIKLPVAIIRAALRIGGGHLKIGGFDSNELEAEVMAGLQEALREGETGLVVDVQERDGDHVQIFLE